jgi:hypothetical protein
MVYPEVILQAKAFHAIGVIYDHEFVLKTHPIGAAAIDKRSAIPGTNTKPLS